MLPKEALSVNNQRTNSNKTASNKLRQSLETQSKVNCHICEKNYNIQNCEKTMSQGEKSKSIKKTGLCFNCFRANQSFSM